MPAMHRWPKACARGGGLGDAALRGVGRTLYSDTVTAVVVPAGCNGTDLVKLAADKYGVAFGVGLGEVAGKVFRIGHLGMLTDVMVLAGLATAEMCMADLGWPCGWGPAWRRRRSSIAGRRCHGHGGRRGRGTGGQPPDPRRIFERNGQDEGFC
jgi:hypothetical protein